MILEILRSALVVGTVAGAVAMNGFVPVVPLIDAAATAPSLHSTASVPVTPVPAVKVSRLKRVQAAFPDIRRIRDVQSGLATWYGKVLNQHRTASGEIFDSALMTGASNSVPLGTRVRVTNLKNGLSVIVKVNDRGLLGPGRIIDLSSAAADKIGLLRMGVAPVHMDVLAAAF